MKSKNEIDQIIEKYMRIAIEEAEIAKANGENPFGAVLLDPEYNFCHKNHSRSVELSDPTAHAETLVIREYCQQHNKQNLKDYILISSGEPCIMCSGAIKWAKIQQIYFYSQMNYQVHIYINYRLYNYLRLTQHLKHMIHYLI